MNANGGHVFVEKLRRRGRKAAEKLSSYMGKFSKNEIDFLEPIDKFCVDFNQVSGIYDDYSQKLSECGISIPGSSINDCYFKQTVDPKMILIVGLGKNVRGNMLYVLQELNLSESFDGFRIFVRTSEKTDDIVRNFIARNHWSRTETVPDTEQYRVLMETAKYMLTEVYFPEAWVKKPEQVYINIWHGTPLKKLGLSKNFQNTHKNGTPQKNFMDADYLLYPNIYTRNKMLESYKVSQLMKGKVLMLGYPRTGGMLAASPKEIEKVRNRLVPNGEKLYTFMPTFRDYLSVETVVAQAKELLDYLDANMSDEQVLYVNLHHKVNDSINYDDFKRVRQFPADIDSYQILAASDGLISDYSSVFFDYLALRRQIILYIADYEEYKEKRGMYMELKELPFDMAETKEEVLSALNRGKQYDDTAVFREFCAYDSPENAKKLCQLILQNEEGLLLEEIPQNRLPKVLIHSDLMRAGSETKMLDEFTHIYEKSSYEIYMSCDMSRLDSKNSGAYPMFFENPVIGSECSPHLSSVGRAMKKLYMEEKISFAEAMDYLQYDYALMPKRMFGQAEFDVVVIYDSDDPERVIAFAEMGVTTFLFLRKYILEKIADGNVFLRDAVCYAARYCSCIFAPSASEKKQVIKLLGQSYRERVFVISSAEQMNMAILKAWEAKQ